MTQALELSGVIKDYRGLRPLRIERLAVADGDQVAILGIDQPSAEVLVNLITGTTLPDRGMIRVFGQSTADIRDSTEWMALVDRFGIVSQRAVLLEGLSAVQNLSMPFSLDVEPPSEDVRGSAVALAQEVGLDEADWDARLADLDANRHARVRLGRALALDPKVLLLEHPTAAVPRADVVAFAHLVRSVVERRGAAALALTADRAFAETAFRCVWALDPASGRLTQARARWFALGGR